MIRAADRSDLAGMATLGFVFGCTILLRPERAAPAGLLALGVGAGAVATAARAGYGPHTGHDDTTGLALDAVGFAAWLAGVGVPGSEPDMLKWQS